MNRKEDTMSKKKEKETGYDDGSYVIKTSRKSSIFAFVLCLLIACIIWLFAANKERNRSAEAEVPESESASAEICIEADTL